MEHLRAGHLNIFYCTFACCVVCSHFIIISCIKIRLNVICWCGCVHLDESSVLVLVNLVDRRYAIRDINIWCYVIRDMIISHGPVLPEFLKAARYKERIM